METEEKRKINHYLFWAVVFGLVILAALIIRPYLIPLLSAFILAYLTRPIFTKLKKIMPASLAAMLCIIIVLLIVIIPLVIITAEIIQQASDALQNTDARQKLSSFSNHYLIKKWNIDVIDLREKGITTLVALITKVISSIPSLLVGMLIMGFSMFYMLTSWETLALKLKRYIPFKDKERTAAEIDKTTRAIVYGTLLIALLEFIVAAIGFYLSGINAYILLATIIFFFAFIPGFGPIAVWAPLALFQLSTQNYLGAIGVIITGIIISFGIELVLLSRFVGQRSQIHPLIMLLGVVGGISLFGIFGFIIGPLVLAYTVKLIEESAVRV